MSVSDFPDLTPPESVRASRARKRNKAAVIERAWEYLEENPSGLSLEDLCYALALDIGLHPTTTILTYLKSESSRLSPNATFELFVLDDVTLIKPKPTAVRRRQRGKGNGHA